MRLDIPPALTRALSRYAVPITVVAAVLLLGTTVAVAALLSPASLPLPASTRVSETAVLPETLQGNLIDERDTDNDGLGDALENYVYGTDSENWDSSGTGIPDGWLVAAGFDPLSPATRTARGATPDPETLPDAYRGEWPQRFRLPLAEYYNVGKPDDYVPGEDAPWWTRSSFPNPRSAIAPSGLPTAWLVYYGLDANDPDLGDRPASGGASPLSVRKAFEHNTNPLLADSDEDGLTDEEEIGTYRTDPSRFSTSGSGIADGWAVKYGLDPADPDIAGADADNDGLTNLEEFLRSYEDFRPDVEAEGIQVLFTRGLNPLDPETSGSGIPDGWYVAYGLNAYAATEADRELQKASDYSGIRWLTDAPPGLEPLPDLAMTVRDAYEHGRPGSWNERLDGPWWGGTNPAETDSDGDGLPDAVEIRGWYVNLTFELGPQAASEWLLVYGNPTDADSDADGLSDFEEYSGRALCTPEDARQFNPTDARNKDSAFSGLTDREKVCGVVRGAFTYDFTTNGGAGLDPTRADSAGDYLRDGAKVDYWHERYARYVSDPTYEYENSSYADVTEWATKYARFQGKGADDVVKEFRPDGDVDGDGLVNVLDPDPSGGLVDLKNPRVILLPQGLQIDPTLYRFSEYRSSFPRSTSDPANPDTDGDGLPDWWEVKFGVYVPEASGWNLDPSRFASLGNGVSDATRNDDEDVIEWSAYRATSTGARVRVSSGLEKQPYDYSNLEEYLYGTNPNVLSTVGDGVADGWKVFWGIVYPTLAAQGSAGDLTTAELDAIRTGAGNIGPLLDLRDKGHPDKVHEYVRYVKVGDCDNVNEEYLKSASVADWQRLGDAETLDQQTQTGRLACPISALTDGDAGSGETEVHLARITGTFTLTYRHESDYGTNPYLVDTDGDGATDAYEACYMRPAASTAVSARTPRGCSGHALPPVVTSPSPTFPDVVADHDEDGALLAAECGVEPGTIACGVGSDPVLKDTDGDGVEDGLELGAGLDPLNPGDVDKFRSQIDLDGDGILDFQELTGWGKVFYQTAVRTDPGNPDSDRLGCAGSDVAWRGDNLLDGSPVDLAPTSEKAKAWQSLGLAHSTRVKDGVTVVTFFGEAPKSHPLRGDTSCDGIPDGWLTYYFNNGAATDPSSPQAGNVLERYERSRPTWWDEAVHGTWWWGAAPNGDVPADLDGDGLLDRAGEDPFPATSLNRYSWGGSVFTDPLEAADFVQSTLDPDEARLRAQAWGEGAGNPIAARDAAAAESRVVVRTRLDDVHIVDAEAGSGGRFEIQKGEEFVIAGRLVVDEGADAGDGVPNATVLVSALTEASTRHERVIGVAFTDADGRFEMSARIAPDHSMAVPDGLVLFGKTGGTVSWSVSPDVIAVGETTAGANNALVVWTYRSPPDPAEGTPYAEYAFRKPGGGTAKAVDRTEASAIPLLVTADTRVAFDIPGHALNGDVLRGNVLLTDAGGSPLADRAVVIRWTGAGATPIVLGAGAQKIRTDDAGLVNLTELAIPVATAEPGGYTLEVSFTPLTSGDDQFLRASVTTETVNVRNPVELKAFTLTPSLSIGSEFLVDGSLRILPYTLPGGGTAPGGPAAGERVRIEIGSVIRDVTTDPTGHFAARVEVPADMPAGANRVKVSYAGSNELDDAGPIEIPINVKRGTEIVGIKPYSAPRGGGVNVIGRLVDANGDGLTERRVSVSIGGGATGATTATSQDGAFALRVPIDDKQKLGLATLTVSFAGDDEYASTTNSTSVKVYSTTRFIVESVTNPVVRGNGFTIGGRLVDSADRGVGRAAVELYWAGREVAYAVTDDAGRFTVTHDVDPLERLGDVQIGLLYSPPATSEYRAASHEDERVVLADVDLQFVGKDVRRGIVHVSGRLLDDRGNALPGQAVHVTWAGENVGTARTLRNGSFIAPYEMPPTHAIGPVTAVARYAPDAGARYAPANTTTTFHVIGRTEIVLEDASEVIRGEPLTLSGTLLQDNGAHVAGDVSVHLGDRHLGNVTVQGGRFVFDEVVPTDVPRGETTLVVAYAGTRHLDPARLDVPVTVKIRPQVQVVLPKVALEGNSFSGEVTILDDQGEPLRNQSFVYLVGGNPQSIQGATDAEGKAVIAGVARTQGGTVALAVRGGGGIVPTEYSTSSIQVLGPSVSPGLGIAAVVGLLVIVLLVAAVAYAFMRRRQLEEVRGILDRAIDELLAGNEYVGTIFLTYKRLSAHLASHGFIEKQEDTAREFATGVRRALPISAESLRVLIRLFEEARYSDHAVGVGERDRAIESLSVVRSEIDQLLGRAVAAPAQGVAAS